MSECYKPGCSLPKEKPKHGCLWHAEAKLAPDDRANRAALRRAAWDGTRKRGDGSCAGCGGKDVPADYFTGSRCKSCAILDRREKTFGITAEQQALLHAATDGACMGCQRKQRFKANAIDHNHETGEVRGVLEQMCNQTIGAYFDNPAAFLSIAVYLIAPPARQILDPANALSREQIIKEVSDLLDVILEERKL